MPEKANAASEAVDRLNKELRKKQKHKSKSSPLMRNHHHPTFAHLIHDAFLRLDCNPRSNHLGYSEETLRKNIRLHYNTKLGKRFRRNFQVSLAKLVAEGKLIPHDTEEDGILYLPTQKFVDHFKQLKIPHQYLSHRRFAFLLNNHKRSDTESLLESQSPSIPTSRNANIRDMSSSRSPSGRRGSLEESPARRTRKSKRERPNKTPAGKSKDKPSKSPEVAKKKDKTSKSKNKHKPKRSRRGSIVDLGVEDQPNRSRSRQRSKVDLVAGRHDKPGQKYNKTPDRHERVPSKSRERPSGDRRAKKRKSVEPNKSKSPSGGTRRRNESPSRARRSRGGRGRGKTRKNLSQSPLSSRSDDSRQSRTLKRGKQSDRDSKSRSPSSRSYLSKWLWGDSGSSKRGKGSRAQKSKQPRSKSPSSRSTSKDRSRSPKMSKRHKRGRSPSFSQSPKRSRQRSKGISRSLKRSKPARKKSGSHSRSPKRKLHKSKSPSRTPKGSKPKRSRSPQRRRTRSPSSGYKAYGSGYRLPPKRRPNFRRTSSPDNYVNNHYVDDRFDDDSTSLQDEENEDDYEDITDDGNNPDENLNDEILGDGVDVSNPPWKNDQNSRNLFQRLGDSIRNAFGGVSGMSRTSSGAVTPLQHRHDHPTSKISTSNLTPPRSPRNRPEGHALSHNPRSPRGKPKLINNDPRSPRGGSAERLSDNSWSMRSRVDYSPPSPRSRGPKHVASNVDPEFEPNEKSPHGSRNDSVPNESMPFSARLANLLRE